VKKKQKLELEQYKRADLIDEALCNFNFFRVQSTMEALDWRWARCNGVPDIMTMRAACDVMLKRAYDEIQAGASEYEIGSGGFDVYATTKQDGDIVLKLRFVVCEYNTYDF
jgi:hypothetical protein